MKYLLLCLALGLTACQAEPELIDLRPGLLIDRSVRIRPGEYVLPASDSLQQPVITIRGEDLTIDFAGAVLRGAPPGTPPDAMRGLAIRVEGGRNIRLLNVRAHGYKVGLLADGVDSLRIEGGDLSYNYRQRLHSRRDRENLADWLSYHQNEQDEWLRYGAGVYLRNCTSPSVRDLHITGGQNGLLMTGCTDGLFFNNTFQFNSGVGLGMYRSSRNRIMHNRLDYNVRGYSHGVYQRGQDSAGLLCYEQSNDNTFAYNSATHSGDGFFLWAGRQTMDSGAGGCNDNLIFGNDFSHAPTNGAELTFSRNDLVHNTITGCRYGIWAGYSYQTRILGNTIRGNETGIAIEHGHANQIAFNLLEDHEQGVRLWERPVQPEDWGFARARDVSSRDYHITDNVFHQAELALAISQTPDVVVARNRFSQCDRRWEGDPPAPTFRANVDRVSEPIAAPALPDSLAGALRPPPLAEGMDVRLPEGWPAGRRSILIGPWGPYDYRYPAAWLRRVEGDTYVFLLEGPTGNWKLNGGEGFLAVNPKTGTFPATVTARADPGARVRALQWTFIGEQAIGPLGDTLLRGTEVPFAFRSAEWTPSWEVRVFTLPGASGGPPTPAMLPDRPADSWTTDTLAYVWWDGPSPAVGTRFFTEATTSLDLPPGTYHLKLSSDEGARVYLDGDPVLDDWMPHEARVRTTTLELAGRHRLKVEHYNLEGLATLDLELHALPSEASTPDL